LAAFAKSDAQRLLSERSARRSWTCAKRLVGKVIFVVNNAPA
jgi:hypothetical protein